MEAQKEEANLTQNASKERQPFPKLRKANTMVMLHGTNGRKLHRIQSRGNVKLELYNLEKDPMEATDLSFKQPERTKSMRTDLEAWQALCSIASKAKTIQKMKHLTLSILFVSAIFLKPTLEAGKPNFVIIFTDDQGYADIGCFGSTDIGHHASTNG